MRIKTIAAVLAVAAVAIVTVVGQVSAAETAFGTVDPGKIWQSHPKVQQARQELMKLNDLLEKRLTLRDHNRLLTEAEMTELQDLKEKAKPTDPEKTRTKELEDLAKQRDVQRRELIAKKDPSEEERAVLSELENRYAEADRTLGETIREYDKQLKSKEDELTKGMPNLDQEILNAVKAVAEAKKLGLVISQQAVLFGGTDITEDVITQMNKKK
jgi:Skp family chaperone for outer membrane proteins